MWTQVHKMRGYVCDHGTYLDGQIPHMLSCPHRLPTYPHHDQHLNEEDLRVRTFGMCGLIKEKGQREERMPSKTPFISSVSEKVMNWITSHAILRCSLRFCFVEDDSSTSYIRRDAGPFAPTKVKHESGGVWESNPNAGGVNNPDGSLFVKSLNSVRLNDASNRG